VRRGCKGARRTFFSFLSLSLSLSRSLPSPHISPTLLPPALSSLPSSLHLFSCRIASPRLFPSPLFLRIPAGYSFLPSLQLFYTPTVSASLSTGGESASKRSPQLASPSPHPLSLLPLTSSPQHHAAPEQAPPHHSPSLRRPLRRRQTPLTHLGHLPGSSTSSRFER
jgi:hypothetical protein